MTSLASVRYVVVLGAAGFIGRHAARLFSGRLLADDRRIARHDPADSRDVGRRSLAEDNAGRARLPAANGARQSSA